MFYTFERGVRTAPSQYPRIPFHVIRVFQLIASLVVGAIMCYFIWHLTHDHWATPWTFIWLTSASLFSIAALAFTIILYCLTGLNSGLNLYINGFLTLLWTLSWSLLTWFISGTLANMCDIDHWNEEIGIMVCRIYKALFSFTLVGLVSTLAALALDIYVYRQQNRLGIYRLQSLDQKSRPEAIRGPFTDDSAYEVGVFAAGPRESEAWEPPRSFAQYAERTGDKSIEQQGYAVPEAQFEYDTGYHGGHAER